MVLYRSTQMTQKSRSEYWLQHKHKKSSCKQAHVPYFYELSSSCLIFSFRSVTLSAFSLCTSFFHFFIQICLFLFWEFIQYSVLFFMLSIQLQQICFTMRLWKYFFLNSLNSSTCFLVLSSYFLFISIHTLPPFLFVLSTLVLVWLSLSVPDTLVFQ